jgi:hypothetical protein
MRRAVVETLAGRKKVGRRRKKSARASPPKFRNSRK